MLKNFVQILYVNMYLETGIIYTIVLILSFVLAYFAEYYHNPLLILICYLFIVGFWSIRYGIGHDYMSYVKLFQEVKSGYGGYVETGYRYLNWIFRNYSLGYLGVMGIMLALSYLFLFKALVYEKIFSLGVFFALSLHLEFFLVNGVRQGLVIVIFLYAIHFIEEKKYLKYIFWTVLSSFFHLSALSLLLVFLIPRIYLRKNLYYGVIVIAYCIYLAGSFRNVGILLLKNMPFYEYYQTMESRMLPENEGFSIVTLLWVLVGLYIVYRSKVINRPFILNVYVFGLVLYIVFNDFHLIQRFTLPFVFLNVLLFSLAVKYSPCNKRIVLIVFLLLFSLSAFKGSSSQGVFPYKTIWDVRPVIIC